VEAAGIEPETLRQIKSPIRGRIARVS
jgi:hypothetical protein